MVTTETFSSVSRQTAPELRTSGPPAGSSEVAVGASAAHQRRRASIADLDRATCRTRLSQRQFLIQLQADSACGFRSEHERFRGGTTSNQWSARVVDWD